MTLKMHQLNWLCLALIAMLLAGCGSSNTVSALSPARVIVFGDAFSSLGAGGAGKYTVNDGTVNNWTRIVR